MTPRSQRCPLRATVALLLAAPALVALPAAAVRVTYTLDADFDRGDLLNVNHEDVADQLQIGLHSRPRPYLWVAASERGTVVKVDVRDGRVLGEYLSAPEFGGRNPSRTTVDHEGNVWVGNRDEAFPTGLIGEDGRPFVIGDGSVVKIGLLEEGQCVDRDGDGVILTSTGLGDVRPWSNVGLVDRLGGVSTAEDECILLYRRVDPAHVRQVSIDTDGNVWVGGDSIERTPEKKFQLLDGETGAILRTIDLNDPTDTGQPPLYEGPFGPGYGGFVDCDGHLWSAAQRSGTLVRIDPHLPNGHPGLVQVYDVGDTCYGIGLGAEGEIWVSTWLGHSLVRFAHDGTIVSGPHPTVPPTPGDPHGSRGVAVGDDGHVWVANSSSNTVSRQAPDGSIVAIVPVGEIPTGVAIDTNGKIWCSNRNTGDLTRIDPATNTVDLVVSLDSPTHPIGPESRPYNYSDMTGKVVLTALPFGRWTVTTDGGCEGLTWDRVSWTSAEPDATHLVVEARAGADPAGLSRRAWQRVTSGATLSGLTGSLLETRVSFETDEGAGCFPPATPVLFDLTVEGFERNRPTIDCPGDLTVECDAVPPPERPTATDDCDVPALTLVEEIVPGPCGDQRTILRRWTASDTSGNAATCTQTITVLDRTAPLLLDVPADMVLECGDPLPPPAAVTSTDGCDPSPVLQLVEQVEPGDCPGEQRIRRTWTATDRCGNATTASQTIAVLDRTAPVLLDVPADVVLECGDPLPPPAAVTAIDGCDPSPLLQLVEQVEPGDCAGERRIRRTWTATDGCGHAATASQTIVIVDTTPPEITVVGGPGCLWPPNHRYWCTEDIADLVVVSDACPGEVALAVVGCDSDQPDNQQGDADRGINGDGDTTDDCVVADDGGGFCVRSERLGQCKAGRTYGVTLRATDSCGNSSDAVLSIQVPHDEREHPECAPERVRDLLLPHEGVPFPWTPETEPDAGLPDPFTCPTEEPGQGRG